MSKDTKSGENDNEKSPTRSLYLRPRPSGRAELMAYGAELGVLLESTVFNIAWDSTVQDIQNEMVVAESDQEVLNLKAELDAAGRLINKLSGMVASAKLLSKESLMEEEANRQLEYELDDGT
jgi:hypothetical protein